MFWGSLKKTLIFLELDFPFIKLKLVINIHKLKAIKVETIKKTAYTFVNNAKEYITEIAYD